MRLRWTACAAIAATTVLSGCTSTVIGHGSATHGSSSTTAPPASTATPAPKPATHVAAADLPRLLLSIDEIRKIMDGPTMEIEKTITQPAGFEGATFAPLECVGPRFNAMAVTYDGSGQHAFLDQETDEREPAPLRHGVDQAVALFDDAATAHALVTKSAEQWRKCAGVEFTATFADKLKRPTWTLGETSGSDGIILLAQHPKIAFWDCTHAMAAKANVVVDNLICAYDLADRPLTVTKAILAKIPS